VALASIPTVTAIATVAATAVVAVVTFRTDEAALDINMLCNIRKQCKLASALDSVRNLALVATARTSDATAAQLASV
jgi:hypothetical protein